MFRHIFGEHLKSLKELELSNSIETSFKNKVIFQLSIESVRVGVELLIRRLVLLHDLHYPCRLPNRLYNFLKIILDYNFSKLIDFDLFYSLDKVCMFYDSYKVFDSFHKCVNIIW